MRPPLLVFDLDGTLADSAPDLLATLGTVLPRYGFRTISDAILRDGIGHGARALIEHALKEQGASVDAPTMDAIHRDFLAYYEANISVGTRLFPGTDALLDRFAAAGWLFAVCTNKPEKMSRLLLRQLGISDRFAAICGGDSFAYRKPDPRHLLETIDAASGARGRSIMVGDSKTDLETARNATVPMVGVTFGYTPVAMALLGPDLLVDNYDALSPETAAKLLEGSARATPGRDVEAAPP